MVAKVIAGVESARDHVYSADAIPDSAAIPDCPGVSHSVTLAAEGQTDCALAGQASLAVKHFLTPVRP